MIHLFLAKERDKNVQSMLKNKLPWNACLSNDDSDSKIQIFNTFRFK